MYLFLFPMWAHWMFWGKVSQALDDIEFLHLPSAGLQAVHQCLFCGAEGQTWSSVHTICAISLTLLPGVAGLLAEPRLSGSQVWSLETPPTVFHNPPLAPRHGFSSPGTLYTALNSDQSTTSACWVLGLMVYATTAWPLVTFFCCQHCLLQGSNIPQSIIKEKYTHTLTTC